MTTFEIPHLRYRLYIHYCYAFFNSSSFLCTPNQFQHHVQFCTKISIIEINIIFFFLSPFGRWNNLIVGIWLWNFVINKYYGNTFTDCEFKGKCYGSDETWVDMAECLTLSCYKDDFTGESELTSSPYGKYSLRVVFKYTQIWF